jgi:hypothetical protein|tara:strand:+ start:10022 stop:10129 length:108 start_codon:yes stop_codon:yes gene_type:complete
MKAGERHRYWAKFKSRKKHYLAGKYRMRQIVEEEE